MRKEFVYEVDKYKIFIRRGKEPKDQKSYLQPLVQYIDFMHELGSPNIQKTNY